MLVYRALTCILLCDTRSRARSALPFWLDAQNMCVLFIKIVNCSSNYCMETNQFTWILIDVHSKNLHQSRFGLSYRQPWCWHYQKWFLIPEKFWCDLVWSGLVQGNKRFWLPCRSLIQYKWSPLQTNRGFSCDVTSSKFCKSSFSRLPCWFPVHLWWYWEKQQNVPFFLFSS